MYLTASLNIGLSFVNINLMLIVKVFSVYQGRIEREVGAKGSFIPLLIFRANVLSPKRGGNNDLFLVKEPGRWEKCQQ